MNVQGKETPIKVALKDILWIPGLPCRLLSIGTVQRDGREFVESGTKENYFRLKEDVLEIPLPKRKGLDFVGIRSGECRP